MSYGRGVGAYPGGSPFGGGRGGSGPLFSSDTVDYSRQQRSLGGFGSPGVASRSVGGGIGGMGGMGGMGGGMGGMGTGGTGGDVAASSGAGGQHERYIRMLEQNLETMRHELRAARDRANSPELQNELQRAHEALRREQMRAAELERELAAARDMGVQARDLQAELDMQREVNNFCACNPATAAMLRLLNLRDMILYPFPCAAVFDCLYPGFDLVFGWNRPGCHCRIANLVRR